MAVRIYALAKELKVDSKDLVDLCAKAGLPGKGSALASLTDEEAERVKAYVSGGARAAEPRPTAATATATATATTTVAPPRTETETLAPSRPWQTGAVRREDYIAPGGMTGKPKTIETRTDKPPTVEGKKKPAEGDAPKSPAAKAATSGPRMAPIPLSPAAPPPSAHKEPEPQKPDIKLPIDAIRASKAGSKPLSEHLRKHEEKRAAEEKTKTTKPTREIPAKPAPAPVDARGRLRRGKLEPAAPAEPESAEKSLLGGRAQRQLQRKKQEMDARSRAGGDDEGGGRRSSRLRRSSAKHTAAPRKSKVSLQLPATLRSFCEAVGAPVAQVQKMLIEHGAMLTINSLIDAEQAEFLAIELGVELDVKAEVTLEEETLTGLDAADQAAADQLVPRAPIITFLGHVDHGKTSLLDRIIGIDVASGESGGITQHIRAYQIERAGRKISFVDTPGHEAFTEMRARGANVTDLAVLVVAADDGVMPQTEEAISHARAAGVPIVVALNKIDLPGINIDRIYQQLSTAGLVPSEWSPDGVEVVKTSATTGQGIDDLLETLLLTADLQEYKANPDRAAAGTCLEAQREPGRGIVAKLMVQKGTLHVGDIFMCGATSGRVQAMYDTLDLNRHVTEATPSMPVNVSGLDEVPEAGDRFYVLPDIATARQIAAQRGVRARQVSLAGRTHVTLENLFDRLGERENVQTVNLVLRADVRGSIEAIQNELAKLHHEEVQIRVLQALVGGITEADVHLAHASDAIIIGFNVVADEAARALADKYKVDVRRYDIIYKLTEDLKQALEGKLKPEEREVELGRALVQQVFSISRVGSIAGCRVLSGTVQRNCRVRVIRDNRIIGDYALESLKREKDDAREVREGLECGMKLAGFNDIKAGDVLEAYKIEEIQRTLD